MWNHKLKMCAVVASLAGSLLFVPSLVPFEGKAVAATAKETESARTAIQAAYAKRDAFAANRDANGYWSLRTQNYVRITAKGQRRTAAELKPEIAKLFRVAESINGRAVIQKISLQGNTAIVEIYDSGTMTIPVGEGRTNVIEIAETARETWVKRNGKWLLSQSKALTTSARVNGKAVQMP